jgi:dienelactone hydrolase
MFMFERFFHGWEHRLASATTDRVVRPFDWGLDWLPSNGNGHDPASVAIPLTPDDKVAVPLQPDDEGRIRLQPDPDADERIERWVEDALADSDAFFTPAPTDDFRFEPAPETVQRTGESGTLIFPSALPTPHPENNVVRARWFPARGVGVTSAARGRGRAVVVLPQWNSDANGHVGLSRLLARCGVSALRLSLPYHDARMPPELSRADYIVSANVVRTVQVCRQAVLDARRAVSWLSSQGFDRIGILGTSLGSCLSMLTAAHEPRIRAAALNHVSPWFADVVWHGLSTKHVRQGLDGHIDLDRLRRLWRPISPWSHMDRAAKQTTRTLLVYAKYDLTFPVDLSETLVAEYRRRGIAHEVARLPCGHYSTGLAPFKYLDAYVLIRFLRGNL